MTDATDPLDAWRQDVWNETAAYGIADRAAAIFDRIAALEELGAQMRQDLIAHVKTSHLTAEEVAEIYWRFDKVPVAALGFTPEAVRMKATAHPYWSWRCRGCGTEIFVQSRNELQERVRAARGGSRNRGPSTLCADCRTVGFAEREAAWKVQQEQMQQRERKLRTMPYREYLQTPEWQERRKAALKRAGYKCQVCNRSRQLHTHHRTYERRGAELARDLIVLCDECHALYHGKGLLPAHEHPEAS